MTSYSQWKKPSKHSARMFAVDDLKDLFAYLEPLKSMSKRISSYITLLENRERKIYRLLRRINEEVTETGTLSTKTVDLIGKYSLERWIENHEQALRTKPEKKAPKTNTTA